MCLLFFFSLSLATSEKSSHRGCSLKVVLKTFAKLKLYKEKQSGTGIFLWFLRNFLKTSFLYNISGRLLYCYYLNYQFFEVFFLLTYKMCIYGSFGSLCICFCFTLRVLKIIQIVLTLTKFVLYVSWLKSCHLVFFFESMNWFKKEKKREKFSECFTHGSGKTIKVFNQVFSNMSWATKLKFSSTILQYFSYFIRVAKMKRNKSAI